MKFGFCVMSDASEIGFFSHAEALGYDSVWATDSQMLFSDCYQVLALAARQTSRLRIGPGTAITGTRIAPVQACSMATLNALAPGRVFLGIGTGHTAMRTMGQRPTKMAEYSEYLRVLAALLRGETVDYTFEGVTKPIRMLHREGRGMRLDPPIPLYVSGFGPRAMALAGEHGDGIIFAIPPRGVPVAEALAHARQGAARVGRAMDGFRTATLSSVFVLEPGERADSDRVKAAIGPNVMASVCYVYATIRERGIDPPPFLERMWDRFCRLVDETPPEIRHFRTHGRHYTALFPGEAELIDARLVRDTCLVGEPDELVAQIRALERDGLRELIFAIGTDAKWRLAEDFARLVMPKIQ